MPEDLSDQAVKQLQDLRVEIKTGSKVLDVTDDGIRTGDEFISAKTILWAAGVAAVTINKKLDVELDRQGRVIVKNDCSIKNFPYIFVIGDQAHHEYGPKNAPLPGLAPVAMQQGRYVAKTIIREQISSILRDPFRYVDKGQMATVGRSKAVAEYKGIHITGFFAWISWLFVHVYYLIGFKNRFSVIFQWAWTYFTYNRGARLIVENESLRIDEKIPYGKEKETVTSPPPLH